MTALSDSEIAELRNGLDRAAILEVINRYYHGLDSRNFDVFADVFTEDAEYVATLVDGSVHSYHNRNDIVAALRGVNTWRTSHHGVRNYGIAIDGQRATANIYAMDALIDDRKLPGDMTAGARLIQHGLRYVDVLEKLSVGWRIKSRRLYCLWQTVNIGPGLLAEIPVPR